MLYSVVGPGSFYVAKHPARIRSVLNFVYSVDRTNVDDELVHSIEYATRATTAPEVLSPSNPHPPEGGHGALPKARIRLKNLFFMCFCRLRSSDLAGHRHFLAMFYPPLDLSS